MPARGRARGVLSPAPLPSPDPHERTGEPPTSRRRGSARVRPACPVGRALFMLNSVPFPVLGTMTPRPEGYVSCHPATVSRERFPVKPLTTAYTAVPPTSPTFTKTGARDDGQALPHRRPANPQFLISSEMRLPQGRLLRILRLDSIYLSAQSPAICS